MRAPRSRGTNQHIPPAPCTERAAIRVIQGGRCSHLQLAALQQVAGDVAAFVGAPLVGAPDLIQMPNNCLNVRAVVAIDSALARSSAWFFGLEKPWPVPL
jgi:hypothetical protein